MGAIKSNLIHVLSPESKEMYDSFYQNPFGVDSQYKKKEYYNGNAISIPDMPNEVIEDIIDTLNDYLIPVEYHDAFVAIMHYLLWNFKKESGDDSRISISEWEEFGCFISGWFHEKIKPIEIIFKGIKPGSDLYDVRISHPDVIYSILAQLAMSDVLIRIKNKDNWDINDFQEKRGRPENHPLRFTIFLATKAIRLVLNYKLVKTRYQAEKLFSELFQIVGIIKEDSPYPYEIAKAYFKRWRNKF